MAKEGILYYNKFIERYDICFDVGDLFGGLHCGDCFEVYIDGKWIQTSIEMAASGKWYLTDVTTEKINGLKARIG